MSITAVNAFYQGAGANLGGGNNAAPTVSGEILAVPGLTAGQASDLQGFCLPVLDGSATTFTLNWIDGTLTLLYPPSAVFAYKTSAPAWTASTYYPLNAIVLGSAHIQQVTAAGKSSTSAPSWKTDGTSVTETSGPTWKDLGAEALSTIAAVATTAITNTGCTVTLSAAGTSTQVPVVAFRIMR